MAWEWAREGKVEAGPGEEGRSPAGDRGTWRHPGRNAGDGRSRRLCGGCGKEGAGRAKADPAVCSNAFVLSSKDRGPGGLRWSLQLSAAVNMGLCVLCSPRPPAAV